MNSTRTVRKSGVRFGQRTKQTGQNDLEKLVRLKKHLKKRWHMDFVREWYIGFKNEKVGCILDKVYKGMGKRYVWRNPDLLCIHPKFGLIIIELDGKIHDINSEKTSKRNQLYRNSGIHLIVLNEADIKSRDQTIEEALDCEMMNGFTWDHTLTPSEQD